jgi:hypothetical protein
MKQPKGVQQTQECEISNIWEVLGRRQVQCVRFLQLQLLLVRLVQ